MIPEVGYMILKGQPILVLEKEDKLIPHYLVEESPEKIISNKELPKGDKLLSLIIKQFAFPSFNPNDFDKFYNKTINHLRATLEITSLFQGKYDPQDNKKVFELLRDTFYYAAQSDAIGIRQKHRGLDSKAITLYHPKLIREYQGNGKSSEIVLKNKYFLKPVLNVYIKR